MKRWKSLGSGVRRFVLKLSDDGPSPSSSCSSSSSSSTIQGSENGWSVGWNFVSGRIWSRGERGSSRCAYQLAKLGVSFVERTSPVDDSDNFSGCGFFGENFQGIFSCSKKERKRKIQKSFSCNVYARKSWKKEDKANNIPVACKVVLPLTAAG